MDYLANPAPLSIFSNTTAGGAVSFSMSSVAAFSNNARGVFNGLIVAGDFNNDGNADLAVAGLLGQPHLDEVGRDGQLVMLGVGLDADAAHRAVRLAAAALREEEGVQDMLGVLAENATLGITEELDAAIPRVTKLNPDVIVVTGDHSTPSKMKSHSWHPVPVLLSANNCRFDGSTKFGESQCLRGGLGQFEAKHLMLRHAFETLGCVRVELKTDARNVRSRTAIARIGAKEEGTLRQHVVLWHGRLRDTVYYSVLDSEWPSVRAALEAKLTRRD